VKKLLISLALILCIALSLRKPVTVHATSPQTWYIRLDGGTATQCTGHTNAAYPGTGSGQPCALSHPFWLLQTGLTNATWRTDYLGGDTVQFADAGPYAIGQGNNGFGTDWFALNFRQCFGSGSVPDCTLPISPPNGSSGAHTKWLGYCVLLGTGCHQSDGSNLKNPTVFKAAAGPYYLFAIQGVNWFDMQGFDLTQPDSCTGQGDGQNAITHTSKSGTVATYTFSPTFGQTPLVNQWVIITGTTNGGGIFNGTFQIASISGSTFTVNGFASGTVADASESGVEVPQGHCGNSNNFTVYGLILQKNHNQGPSNTELNDIGAHGIAYTGVIGSHLNQNPGDTFTANNIFLRGNGGTGWDSDGGGCGTSCESVGTVTFNNIRTEFNGCVEVNTSSSPSSIGTDADGYRYCYAQNTGGQGDGFVLIAAGDVTFSISNSFSRWNTQDGFDMTHLSDDPLRTQIVNIIANWAEGNMGQTFKIGGVADTTAELNFSDGNCRFMGIGGSFPLTLNPSGWNAGLQVNGDLCRGGPDQWAISLSNGHTTTIVHNTSIGYASTMYDISCTGFCDGTEHLIFKDNISKGAPDPGNSGTLPAGFFFQGEDPFANAGSNISYNLWNTMRSSTCPQNGHETNYQCGDPLLVAQSDVNAINPMLTSSSPARGNGITSGPANDYANAPFLIPPAIGMYEFGSTPAPTSTSVGGGVTVSGSVVIQ